MKGSQGNGVGKYQDRVAQQLVMLNGTDVLTMSRLVLAEKILGDTANTLPDC